MKKLFNLILFVVTSLLLLSCEKEKYPGAYPYDNIIFYNKNLPEKRYIPVKQSAPIMRHTLFEDWNRTMYPMELWVDNEEIATISQEGVLTGHKVGEVIVYARVMSINGPIEGSVKYTIGEILSHMESSDIYNLILLGVDKNNDGEISVNELESTDSFKDYVSYDFLLTIAPYIDNLKEVKVSSDTSSNILDLSMFKFRKVSIYDPCAHYARQELNHPSDPLDYEKYEPYFLREIIFNKEYIEHLEFGVMPGFSSMDLSDFYNLRTLKINGVEEHKWSDIYLNLPINIEELDLVNARISCDKVYNKLRKISLKDCLYTELKKDIFPNLRELQYKYTGGIHATNTLDIRSYEFSDFDSLKIYVDTLYLSKSMFDATFGLSGVLRVTSAYIIE